MNNPPNSLLENGKDKSSSVNDWASEFTLNKSEITKNDIL